MSDFTDLTLATARAGLAAKKFSAVELTDCRNGSQDGMIVFGN